MQSTVRVAIALSLYDGAIGDPWRVDRQDALELRRGVRIPLAEIELRASRSSGPGGQHANVTDSRVEAVFDVAESQALGDRDRALLLERLGPRVTAVAQDARSQLRNRELALERLRTKLDEALVIARPRRATAPSKGARERRLAEKRAGAARKAARRPPGQED
jgi:ribosome-associated protein